MATVAQFRDVAEENDAANALAEDRHPEYDEVFEQEEEASLPVVMVEPMPSTFVYDVGHRVQPEPNALARTVIWRGQLKERRPETGWVHRINVYRLNDGFWDCYREDELQAAQLPCHTRQPWSIPRRKSTYWPRPFCGTGPFRCP